MTTVLSINKIIKNLRVSDLRESVWERVCTGQTQIDT